MYVAFRDLAFAILPPEAAHCAAMAALELSLKRRGVVPPPVQGERVVMGLKFPNPVGLAAGFDKNAEHVEALGNLGFGFIEVGCVTLMPQPGKPKPRLFRLPQAYALINRMGFNNAGAERVADNLRKHRYRGIVGINLGKNADTPDTGVIKEYQKCLSLLYAHGDFFTINVSSPNTPNLRDWQGGEQLYGLLTSAIRTRDELAVQHNRTAPIAVKISPDLDDDALRVVAEVIAQSGCDGVIACNTTLARPAAVAKLRYGDEAGGLSGHPLAARATEVIATLRRLLPDKVSIIGVGGIFSVTDVHEKFTAGADLVQIYTGLVYEGPDLPAKLIAGIS